MDKEELIKDLLARLEELRAERAKYEGAWSEAQDFCAPYAYSWHDLDAIPVHPKRFTSEPCAYLDTLVSGLIGYSLSPSIKWFSLSLQNDEAVKLYGVKKWLSDCEQVLAGEFARSNIYSQAKPFVQDACLIGHGCLFMGEDLAQSTLLFQHQCPNEIYLDVDDKDNVDTVLREFRMTVRQMVKKFGEENVGENVRNAYRDPKRRGERRTVLFAVFPREEYDASSLFSRDFPYAGIYIDEQDKTLLEETGFLEFPYAVYSFDKYTGRAYGDSVVQEALEDVKFLDITTETTLKIAQIAADPPIRVSANMRNVAILPGAVNELTQPDDIIEAIKTGDNYPISLDVQRAKNEAVRKRFNVDYFQMLQSLEGKVMTATEVMELQGEKAATLSTLITSMNNALSAIIERSFNLLLRAGKLPEIPMSLSGSNAAMKIEFVGPLAQAQKKYYSSATVSAAMQQVVPVIQLYPQAGDYIDADELVKKTLESAGMPQSVIREDKDVENIRKMRVQAQQAAQEQAIALQQQQNMLQNMDKLNKPVEDGSPLAALDQQLAGGIGA